jgi:hypothetical protein
LRWSVADVGLVVLAALRALREQISEGTAVGLLGALDRVAVVGLVALALLVELRGLAEPVGRPAHAVGAGVSADVGDQIPEPAIGRALRCVETGVIGARRRDRERGTLLSVGVKVRRVLGLRDRVKRPV